MEKNIKISKTEVILYILILLAWMFTTFLTIYSNGKEEELLNHRIEVLTRTIETQDNMIERRDKMINKQNSIIDRYEILTKSLKYE